ncbi:low molecular weight protein-tyrosine-phosphatase [Thalassotalea euphylliae]|nr:low molecular weight protein-tyrosine-phosphatase [Thalassotalea euphylliae]
MNLFLPSIDSILFVCMGNICRSPTAEAVFREKSRQAGLSITIDSAGTIGAHSREKPDHRSQKAGIERGYSFEGIRSRKVNGKDFEKFDLILAMDEQNLRDLLSVSPQEFHYKIKLFLEFANNFEEREVPDPYYGGAGGFKFVVDLIEDASDGLISKIKN